MPNLPPDLAAFAQLLDAQPEPVRSAFNVEGETVTCLNGYTDADLEGMGVGSLEFEWVATIRDGKIQGYSVTMTPESLAKMEVAMAALPETGGVALPSYALAIALGGLTLVSGLSLAMLRRRSP
jgi:hypothetical protein